MLIDLILTNRAYANIDLLVNNFILGAQAETLITKHELALCANVRKE